MAFPLVPAGFIEVIHRNDKRVDVFLGLIHYARNAYVELEPNLFSFVPYDAIDLDHAIAEALVAAFPAYTYIYYSPNTRRVRDPADFARVFQDDRVALSVGGLDCTNLPTLAAATVAEACSAVLKAVCKVEFKVPNAVLALSIIELRHWIKVNQLTAEQIQLVMKARRRKQERGYRSNFRKQSD
jgi:hypothetical protein